MNKKTITLAQLETLKITIHNDFAEFYQFYCQSLIPLLKTSAVYQEQLKLSYSVQVAVFQNKNQLLMTNNLLLLHAIKSMTIPKSDVTRQISLNYIKLSDVNVDNLFQETIYFIKLLKGKHQINCPYQYLHHQLIKLLGKNDHPKKYKQQCQQLFNKNYYSITQFCEGVGITTKTYDRSRNLTIKGETK